MSAYSTCSITKSQVASLLNRMVLEETDKVLENILNEVLGEKHLVRFRIGDDHRGYARWDDNLQAPSHEEEHE